MELCRVKFTRGDQAACDLVIEQYEGSWQDKGVDEEEARKEVDE